MMYTVAGAFDSTTQGKALIDELDKFNVYDSANSSTPMGTFYQNAAAALIDYDPATGGSAPQIVMPHAWDSFNSGDAAKILNLITKLLQNRSSIVAGATGRFQDASRLYRLRIFVRIKGHRRHSVPANLSGASSVIPFASRPGTKAQAGPLPRCLCRTRRTRQFS